MQTLKPHNGEMRQQQCTVIIGHFKNSSNL